MTTPPLPGMTVIPEYYPSPEWDFLFGAAWLGLCEFCLTMEAERAAFEHDTGLSLAALVGRTPLDKLIDQATGHEKKVMAAWCDWVTVNRWGVAAEAKI